jgi:hypothetical protein
MKPRHANHDIGQCLAAVLPGFCEKRKTAHGLENPGHCF